MRTNNGRRNQMHRTMRAALLLSALFFVLVHADPKLPMLHEDDKSTKASIESGSDPHVQSPNVTDPKLPVASEGKKKINATQALHPRKTDPVTPKAVLLQGLNISIANYTYNGGLSKTPVFSRGEFKHFFRVCANESEELLEADMHPDHYQNCFCDSAYTDRIEFILEYDASRLLNGKYVSLEPRNLMTKGGVTRAAIKNTAMRNVSSESNSHSLMLLYNCIPGKNGTATISMVISIRDGANQANVKLAWQKSCLGGQPEHIRLWYLNPYGALWPSDTGKTEVSPSSATSEILGQIDIAHAAHVRNYLQQAFKRPYLSVRRPDVVHAKLRGTVSTSGVLKLFRPFEMTVVYECQGVGESSISLTMGVPPFSNITVSWTKVCGRRVATSLMIGTKMRGTDVVRNGIVQAQFKMSDGHMGTEHSNDHVHLENNRTTWRLYMWADSNNYKKRIFTKSEGLHMGHPVLTVGEPSVVYASTTQTFIVSTHGHRKPYQQYDTGVVIRDDEEVELTFYLVCQKMGHSRILVTIPFLHFESIDFGFAKICDGGQIPTRHVRSAVTIGSGTVLLIMGVLACVAGLVCGYLRLRRRQIEYKRVPTGQR